MISSGLSILYPSVPVIIDIIHDGAEVSQCFSRNSQRNLAGKVRAQSVKCCVENLAAHVLRAASALEEDTEIFDVGRSTSEGVAADLLPKPNGTDGDYVDNRELVDGSVDSLLKRILTHEADVVEVPKAIASHGDLHVKEHLVIGIHRELGIPHCEAVLVVVIVGRQWGRRCVPLLIKLAEILFIELLMKKNISSQLGVIPFVGGIKGTKQDTHNLPFVSFKMGHKE